MAHRKTQHLYMVVTNDEFELPLFVGTLRELMIATGLTESAVRKSVKERRRIRKPRFWGDIIVEVYIEDSDDGSF